MGDAVSDLSGRTVVITGASSGIGLATAVALARAGARVVLTARDPERGERAAAEVVARSGRPGEAVSLTCFDLSSMTSVRRGAAELLQVAPRLDVLVNNAGVVLSERRETEDGFEATFATNHLGPFLLTTLLLDRLRASAPARVVNVASSAHAGAREGLDFDDLQSVRSYRGMAVYGRTKLANILFTAELARRLAGSGVTANSCHPGTVATGYGRDGDTRGLLAIGLRLAAPFLLSPERGAETSVYLASSPEVAGVSGAYFVRSRPRQPSAAARDETAARRLWDVSEALVAPWAHPLGGPPAG